METGLWDHVPILQMRILRLREAPCFAQRLTAAKWQSGCERVCTVCPRSGPEVPDMSSSCQRSALFLALGGQRLGEGREMTVREVGGHRVSSVSMLGATPRNSVPWALSPSLGLSEWGAVPTLASGREPVGEEGRGSWLDGAGSTPRPQGKESGTGWGLWRRRAVP